MSDTQATDVETPTDATVEPDTGESTGTRSRRSPSPPRRSRLPRAARWRRPTPLIESSDAAADSDEADADDQGNQADRADKGDKKSRVRMLEREGEVAADFLETLLDIADLDGDIDVDVDGDRAAIAIVDSDEGRVPRRLVGTDGKVLEALQELTRLAVQVETGERSRLMLDIAGHRAQRRSALVELAKVAIAEVQESGTKRALEPMTAFERKVVHDEVAAAGLVSESEGVDPHRHIVILPA